MNGARHDIAIAGGGLSGGLLALALRQARPELSVQLVEQGDMLGGNHRWSWFASDLDAETTALLEPIRRTGWDEGYDVRFPSHQRRLSTPYRSIASHDFHEALMRELPEGSVRLRAPIAALDAGGITLATGERIEARAVIDARGSQPSPNLTGGWQVFMGRHVRLPEAHGIACPTIMDAAVDQHGAYRFVYVLPLGAFDLFIEDTYYADSPELDRSALSSRIEAYCRDHGWDGDIVGNETGVLPVITGGDLAAWQGEHRVDGVACIGALGGFVHPLTSYTLPFAAQVALSIAREGDLPGDQLAAMVDARARKHWRATKFYRRLGAMLFQAARPEERYRVFERFYRLPEDLIERFYAARSTRADRRRVLCGKPPVPLGRAMRALLTRGEPMAEGQAA
jgi:lycopene beta-cyclase